MEAAVGWVTVTVTVSEVSDSIGVGGGKSGGEGIVKVISPFSSGFYKLNNQLDRSYANPSPQYNIQQVGGGLP